MATRRIITLLLGIACTCVFTTEATAQHNGYGQGYGLGYFDIGQLYRELNRQVPYFAAHPPVYYSYPVARPYGYSPFAYLPDVRTPEIVETIAPQEIINSFYVPSASKPSAAKVDKPSEDMTTQASGRVEPLVVMNPYFTKPKTDIEGSILQAAFVK